jgi:hypothetical protein
VIIGGLGVYVPPGEVIGPPTPDPGGGDVVGLEGLVPNPGIPRSCAIILPAADGRPSDGAVACAIVGKARFPDSIELEDELCCCDGEPNKKPIIFVLCKSLL